MKDCIKQLLLFKGISNKKIEADFNGGEVSSDAGLLCYYPRKAIPNERAFVNKREIWIENYINRNQVIGS